MNWQPIETAPKDGTVVLLLDGGRPYVGKFTDTEDYEFGKLVRKRAGWWAFGGPLIHDAAPTHWMLIPGAPA